jgi:uncharacterized protein YndB with AHSA1/START domain
MPNAADAILQDDQGRAVLRFERLLHHPPERVWRTLTDDDEQYRWHPTPASFEPAVGGSVSWLPGGYDHHVPDMAPGEVIEYDPPRALAHTWGDDRLRWELRPHDEGCLLVLTHTFDDRFKAARDAAGWHLCLDALSAELDGGATDLGRTFERRRDGGARPEGEGPPEWRELNSAYEERFGIPPEKATPPPGRG